MVLELMTATALATQCAPTVAPGTLLSIARNESGFNPLAIHDNTSTLSYFPDTPPEATAILTRLLAQHHSVDAGIQQVNSNNFGWLGVTPVNAFDACTSMRAGATILAIGYEKCRRTSDDEQACIRQAISTYATGSPINGFTDGYVHKVEMAAQIIVPEIRVAGVAPLRPDATPTLPPAAPVVVQPQKGIFASGEGEQFVSTSDKSKE